MPLDQDLVLVALNCTLLVVFFSGCVGVFRCSWLWLCLVFISISQVIVCERSVNARRFAAIFPASQEIGREDWRHNDLYCK